MRLPTGFCRPSRVVALTNGEILLTVMEGEFKSREDGEKTLSGMRKGLERSATGPLRVEEFRNGSQWGGRFRLQQGQRRVLAVAIAAESGSYAMVLLNFDPKVEKTAEEIAATAQLDERAAYDPLVALGIHLDVSRGFELARTSPPVVVKEMGISPASPPGMASLMVMALPVPKATADDIDPLLATLLEEVLKKEAAGTPIKIAPATIDGLHAAETSFDSQSEDGAALKQYGVAIFDGGAALMILGNAGRTRDKELAEIRRMAHSLRREPSVFRSVECAAAQ